MKQSTSSLLEDLCKEHLGPASIHHRLNGKCSMLWYVDDDDDRYVEATDSLHSSKVVLVVQDGYRDWFMIAVLSDPPAIVEWIKGRLENMSRFQSPHGRPNPILQESGG
jgi:hypothetical protein